MQRWDMRRLAGFSGLAVAGLFVVGSLLWWPWGEVRPGATPQAIAGFYAHSELRILWGGGISVIALALLIVFAASLRHLVPASRKLSGDVALAGAVVASTAGLAAEAINMAGALRAADDPALAQTMYELPQVFGGYMSAVGVGVFAVAVAASGLLPRWGAALVGAAGVLLLLPTALFVVEVAGAGLVIVSTLVAVRLLRPVV